MIGIRQLYQIGDVVLHAHHRSGQSQSYQSRGQSVELVDTYRILTSVSAHKTTIRQDTADILLFSNGVYGASQILELLKRQIGVFTDVIGYVDVTRYPAIVNDCGCLQCGCCPCNIMWLHNTGRLVNINASAVDNNTYSVQLTFELHSYWKPLNRLLWTKRGLGLSRNFATHRFDDTLDDRVMQYPTCDSFFDNCIQFYKQQYTNINSFIYDPFWQKELLCANLPNGYPEIGYATYWGTGTSQAMVHVDQRYWSAPPLSIYSFRKIDGLTTSARIRISREEANRVIGSFVNINFDRINTLATTNGYTLTANDVLRVGDVDGFAHVMRSNEIIFYCAEAINRNDGDYPGYITPGTNRIYINPRGAEYWQYHLYRSL